MRCRSILLQTSSLSQVLALVVLTAALGERPAQAGEAELQQAREHFRRGDQAFKAERFEEAYREWESGYKLSGRPLFLLNMAHAERRRGELDSARSLYKKYLLMEPTSQLRVEVEQVLSEIDSALEAKRPVASAAAPAGETSPSPTAPSFDPNVPPAPPPGSSAGGPGLLGPPGAESGIEQSADRPVYKRWWFWAGVGTVVAAGVVTAVLLGRGDDYTRSGSLGTIGMGR